MEDVATLNKLIKSQAKALRDLNNHIAGLERTIRDLQTELTEAHRDLDMCREFPDSCPGCL